MTLRCATTVLCFVSFVFCAVAGASATTYTIQDVGACYLAALNQPFTASVNTAGQVLYTHAVDEHSYLWSGGTATDIGSLFSYNNKTWGSAINNSGVAVGFSHTPSPSPRGYIYSGGTMTNVNTLSGVINGSVVSRPFALNATGQFTGMVGGSLGCFFYNGTTSAQINTSLGGTIANNVAYGLNDLGQVVGGSQLVGSGPAYYPFIWDSSTNVMTRVSSDTAAIAFGVNNSGVAVGVTGGGVSFVLGRAFVATPSSGSYPASPSLLPLLGGGTYNYALAIDATGDVVGGGNVSGGVEHAFCYTGGVMNDLSTTSVVTNLGGWTLTGATSISSDGKYIAGYGTIDGATHAFLLTAVTTPEPSTLLLTVAGLVGLLAYAWRKRN